MPQPEQQTQITQLPTALPAQVPIDNLALITPQSLDAVKTTEALKTQFIKEQLKDKHHFGVIPGCKKPSLWKPGAEMLCKLFGFKAKFIKTEEKITKDSVYVAYFCEVGKYGPDGNFYAFGSCEGSCNSKEKKYVRGNPYDLINTIQKMGQKRAYVGATIQACGASDYFTQDVEDMNPSDLGQPSAKKQNGAAATSSSSEPDTQSSVQDDGESSKVIREKLEEFKGFIERAGAGGMDEEEFCAKATYYKNEQTGEVSEQKSFKEICDTLKADHDKYGGIPKKMWPWYYNAKKIAESF